MKPTRKLFIIFTILLTAVTGFGQLPQGISYQAVARDKNGDELANQNLSVRISILTGSATGQAEWVETHSVQTDQFGLFSLVIGQGSQTGGTAGEFSEINWGDAQHFLKVDIDFGNGYLTMSTTQFLSVPYALYAVSAGSSNSGGGGSDSQQLSYDQSSHVLSLENGGEANLSGLINDADADPANEIQRLELNGNQLSIDKGNTVVLNPNDADADTTNELQYLSLKGNELSISKRNTVTLSGDGDADPKNELQYLYLRDNKLHISKMTADSSILDLGPYLDNTDKQQLSYDQSSQVLSLENGGEANLSGLINDADANPANELQKISRIGDSIRLNQSGGTVSVKDNDADSINELQILSIVNNFLQLSKGNKVPIDSSLTNELQELSRTGDSIRLTQSAKAISVKDNDANPTNELQDLVYDEVNDSITISGGRGISAKNMVNVPWVGFSVYASNVSIDPDVTTTLAFDTDISEPDPIIQTGELIFNQKGYYQINFYFTGSSNDLQYLVSLNGSSLFNGGGVNYNYSFLYHFDANDKITVKVKNTNSSYPVTIGKAEISGFRVH